ncbi:hypothetical protein [Prosthecobacter sp.]|uniref:hypothetical protein n=1 Tax=Prosthecobacter sp. TaxID=1965333 RepID=UPI003782DA9B
MKANPTTPSGKAGFLLLCATALLSFTSCDTYVGAGAGGGPGYGAGYGGYRPGNSAYAPAYGRSNYTYYPQYSTYYHPQTQTYHYNRGNSWVSSPRPYGVSHTVIRTSPSVPLNLNSHPQYHHGNVGQTYPHNWNSSSHGNSGHSYGNGHDHDRDHDHRH